MNIVISAIIYTILLLVAIGLSGFRTTSPNFIYDVSMTIMLYLTCAFQSYFGYDISFDTLILLVGAGFFFMIGEFIAIAFHAQKKYPNYFDNNASIKGIVISKYIYFLLLAFIIGTTFICFVSLRKSTSGSFLHRMSEMKKLQQNGGQIYYSNIVKLFLWVSEGVTYVVEYVLAYNLIVVKEKVKNNRIQIVIIIMYIIASADGYGARQTAIEVIIFFVLLWMAFTMQRKTKKSKNEMKKIYKWIVLIAIAVILIFPNVGQLVGRRASTLSPIKYVATYFCGGLYYLNIHMNNPLTSNMIGAYSFSDLYSFLHYQLHIVPEAVNSYKSFEKFGNTVTILGDWYFDFGIIGAMIISGIVSFLFANYYYRNIVTSRGKNYHLSMILYCRFVITLVWAGYDDRIRTILSFRTLVVMIPVISMYYILIKKKFVFGKRRLS